jgi:competence protein ComEC
MDTGNPTFRHLPGTVFPTVKAALWLALGIFCGEFWRVQVTTGLGLILLLLWIVGVITHRRTVSDAVWIPALLLSGALLQAASRTDLAAWEPFYEKPVYLYGEVTAVFPQPDEKRIFVLRPEWISLDGAAKRFPKGNLRLKIGAEERSPEEELNPGARIALKGEIHPYPSKRNPGGRDLRAEFARKHIVGWIQHRGYEVKTRGNPAFFSRVRDAVSGVLKSILPEREAGLLIGMILGDKSAVLEEVKSDFRSSGLYHLLVVSGAHIGFFLTFLTLFLSPLSLPLRLRRRILLLGVWGYTLLAGGSPPTLRAALMISFVLLSFELKRVVCTWNLLGSAALLILLLYPQQLFQPGFQLSFAAAAGVLFALNWYDRRKREQDFPRNLPRRVVKPVQRFLVLPLLVSLSVVLFTAPILAHHFGSFAPIAVLLNLAAIPLSALIFGLTWLVILLKLTVGWVFEPLCAALELGVKLLASLADLGARSPGAAVGVPFGVLGAFGMLLIYLLVMGSRRWSRRLLWVSGGLACFWLFPLAEQAHALQVEFLDVGQGDATLLQFPDGNRLMIDCGGENPAQFELLPSFRRRGIERIQTLLLTHFDTDHAGGAVTLLENLRVDRLIVNTLHPEEALGEQILQKAAALQIPVQVAVCGDTLAGFRGARCLVIWPPEEYPAGDNPNSLVLRVSFGGNDLLFTGDISRAEEEILMRAGSYLQSEILKVAHHGSVASSSRRFLACIQPRLALIGCGRGNPYGHPAPQTLENLNEIGCQIHRTDLQQAGVWRITTDSIRPVVWR